MRRLLEGMILTVVLGFLSLEGLPTRPLLAQERVVIAIQPTLATDEMLTKVKPLKNFLEQGLGGKVNVEIYVPSSYAAVVESLRFGHAHVAFMSAWPAQLAVQLGGAEVALAEVDRKSVV